MDKMILLVFAYGVLLNSCVFAFTEPKQDTSASEEESQYPKNAFYLTLESKCRDRYIDCTEEYCYRIKTSWWKKKMRRQCKRTCGYCRALSPPACFNSQYGCCWDYVTAALGPGGKGCPPCDDNRRYPNVCRRFKTYCLRKGISGKWMRGHCPDACGHCAIWQFK
ncbi:Hypothetical predicted protein [Paramuricea clavata]|uniref:Uncharacterized protein n=1 Tax=Paramuricea clavata TaxID=317549 RepID=A0A6S7G2W9_PARCT|nr:Hypothetical predicted protein [Paramuricea clavata]